MNTESYYLNQIQEINIEIENIEKRIRRLNQNLENLYEFQTRHNQMSNQFNDNIAERRSRLNNNSLKAQEVKFFLQYSSYMQSMLSGSQNRKILSQKEHEKHIIISKIKEVENEIDNLKYKKYQLEQELSNYNYSY